MHLLASSPSRGSAGLLLQRRSAASPPSPCLRRAAGGPRPRQIGRRARAARSDATAELGESTAGEGAPPAAAPLADDNGAPAPAAAAAGRRSLLLLLASASAASGLPAPRAALAVTAEQLLFLEAWRAVDRAYVDKGFNGQTWFRVRERYLKEEPMRSRQETYAAVRKLLASLDDPFTRFLEPERLAALRSGTKGSVTGVGLEIAFAQQDQQPQKGKAAGAGAGAGGAEVAVVAPAAGGPAEAAGVRAGDVIAAIDGRATAGMSLYEASELLQGEEGTKVALDLRRPSSAASSAAFEKKIAVEITRRRVVVNAVEARLCADGLASASPVGYLRLATFNNNSASASAEAARDLAARGAKRFVLDLRNNGGGVFASAVAVARQWVPKGDLVLIADAQGVRDVYSADPGQLLGGGTEGAPLVVLVNRGTASAAEVLAGALKDSGRARRIVGERTYGKGLIQTVVDLSDGSGVAVTLARYQTPSGTDINKVGIKVDVEAAMGARGGGGGGGGGGGASGGGGGSGSGSGNGSGNGGAGSEEETALAGGMQVIPPPGADALCKLIAEGGADAWFA